MTKNQVVKFLVDKHQLERLKTNASIKGHKTLSAYIREVALNRNYALEKMIIEIHNEVVNNGRTKAET